VFQVLDNIHQDGKITTVVSGAARGADTLGFKWALQRQVKACIYPAEWDKLGKKAGPIRNQRMLDEEHPDLVIAFPGGSGTSDMVSRAAQAKIEFIRVDQP